MRITLLAAQSIDGFITRHDLPGTAFTSPADKAHFSASLKNFDCSIMGGETYRVSRDFIRARLSRERLRIVLSRAPDAYSADTSSNVLEFTQLEPSALVAALRARGYQRCALLGGAQIHSLFLGAGLVDEIWLSIEPVLFGRGTPFLSRQGDYRLRLFAQEKLSNDTLLLKYEVLR